MGTDWQRCHLLAAGVSDRKPRGIWWGGESSHVRPSMVAWGVYRALTARVGLLDQLPIRA
jgi:hypothetical protein